MGDLLTSLNPKQREAVEHETGPLLILAGAGSGKTRTLTHRIAHLMREHRVGPGRILAVTFTNKAAAEMRERLALLLDGEALPWMATFHAACVRILRAKITALGYTSDFVIYDDRDQERLLKDCLADLAIEERAMGARAAAVLIDRAKEPRDPALGFNGRRRARRDAPPRVCALPGKAAARQRAGFQ